MFRKVAYTGATLAALARCEQPGARSPVPAPLRELEWGQINFLHTTDTHGWHAGHILEPQYSADWGDYVSFAEHMRQKADEKSVDLLVIDSGDRIEGNGLYDGSSPKGEYTYSIVRGQNIDLMCAGNHELYQADAVNRELNQTIPNFQDSYMASNLDYNNLENGERTPLAQRYRTFKTKNLGLKVVSFGFLFNFRMNANNTVVQPVEDAINEQWFLDAIREKPDLFVVVGHAGLRMKEFETIFAAIRKHDWYAPIAFFGGHAHVRDARKFDNKAYAIASGRYLETIGFMSIDGIASRAKSDDVAAQATVSFKRRYIDNNLFGLYHHTGLNETTFPTERGKNVTELITSGRKELKLDHEYGCAPQDLWMARSEYPGNSSIFSWLDGQVLPEIVTNNERKDIPRIAILNTGAIRFDILKGAFTRDSTYIVSPFESKFKYIPDVSYAVANRVLQFLNSADQILMDGALDNRFLTIPEQQFGKEDMFEEDPWEKYLSPPIMPVGDGQKPMGSDGEDESTDKGTPELTQGYTTKDDLGTDGDDTVHEPIKTYKLPNCIQSKISFPAEGDPPTVDLVFIDFIQPYMLVALKFSGGDYNDGNVKDYTENTFTENMADWIAKNWKGDC